MRYRRALAALLAALGLALGACATAGPAPTTAPATGEQPGSPVAVLDQAREVASQLEQRVADRTQELAALYRADEELYRLLNLDEVLQALVDVSVDILHADKSAILVWDVLTSKLVHRASHGFSRETIEKLTFTTEEGLIGKVALTGEPAIVEDTS